MASIEHAAVEHDGIAEDLSPPFEVVRPTEHAAPFVFCSPHSGRAYPRHFIAQSRLDPLTLRRSEDCYVDELFQAVPALGAPLIAARFPRALSSTSIASLTNWTPPSSASRCPNTPTSTRCA